MPTQHPHTLMCPPDHYGIEYEINPWMNRQRQADHDLAVKQWQGLVAILTRVGGEISLLAPTRGLPDLVFTANAALIYEKRAVISHFRHPQRQGEEPLCAEWFKKHGFTVGLLPESRFLQGRRRVSLLRRDARRRLSHPQRRQESAATRRFATPRGHSAGADR